MTDIRDEEEVLEWIKPSDSEFAQSERCSGPGILKFDTSLFEDKDPEEIREIIKKAHLEHLKNSNAGTIGYSKMKQKEVKKRRGKIKQKTGKKVYPKDHVWRKEFKSGN